MRVLVPLVIALLALPLAGAAPEAAAGIATYYRGLGFADHARLDSDGNVLCSSAGEFAFTTGTAFDPNLGGATGAFAGVSECGALAETFSACSANDQLPYWCRSASAELEGAPGFMPFDEVYFERANEDGSRDLVFGLFVVVGWGL